MFFDCANPNGNAASRSRKVVAARVFMGEIISHEKPYAATHSPQKVAHNTRE
jgi:hypothetical protein